MHAHTHRYGEQLQGAVEAGLVQEAELDTALRRV
jgi:hypothetical protein